MPWRETIGWVLNTIPFFLVLMYFYAVLQIRNSFFRIRIWIGAESDFSDNFGSCSGSCFGFYNNFLLLFNINFTFVSSSCKCVRLHITTRSKLFRGFFSTFFAYYFLKEVTKYGFSYFFCLLMERSGAGSVQIP